ncbi:MAG TPA: hypothetical protein VIS05_01610 [Ilumatobacter sp.]
MNDHMNDHMNDRFFPYRLDNRWKAMFVVLRVGADDGVTITADGRLVATYGRFTVDTPLDNIDHTQVSGPHRWYTAVGPRLSFSDDGLTFGTNHQRGLCIEFIEKVPRVIGFKNHSALWVSVADPEALAAAIGR